jgi:hypothetical protein
MPQSKQKGGPAAGRAAAHENRQSAELPQQLVHIVGPDLIFRILAIDYDLGSAAIAPVEDYDAVTGLSYFAGQQLDTADIAPPAR